MLHTGRLVLVSVIQLQCHTIRQNSELVGFAEGALGADFHVDSGEAEVVPCVIWLCFSHIQVPRELWHKPTAIFFLDEVGKLIDEPAVGQS